MEGSIAGGEEEPGLMKQEKTKKKKKGEEMTKPGRGSAIEGQNDSSGTGFESRRKRNPRRGL